MSFLQYQTVMAEDQAAIFQSAIMKRLRNCGIQHPVYDPVCSFLPPSESPGCSGNLQHRNQSLWQTDSLTLLWGQILKEIKMSNVPALHFTPSNRLRQGNPIGQLCMVDWMIDRRDRPQSALSRPKSRGSNRGDCLCHLCPSRVSALPLTSCIPPKQGKEALTAFSPPIKRPHCCSGLFLHIIYSNLMFLTIFQMFFLTFDFIDLPRIRWIPSIHSSTARKCTYTVKKKN